VLGILGYNIRVTRQADLSLEAAEVEAIRDRQEAERREAMLVRRRAGG
jgi:hypothetical protein